jgi:hypothetical protein
MNRALLISIGVIVLLETVVSVLAFMGKIPGP